MATDDIQRLVVGAASAPATFTIPGNGQIRPKSVFAAFDGSGAASSFLPALKVTSDAGKTVGIYAGTTAVAAGGSADVSWFPGLGSQSSATPPVGQVRLLYDFTVTGAAKTQIDTALDGSMAGAFPTDLNYLEVFLSGRTDEAIVVSDVNIFLNNDVASTNYVRAFIASAVAGNPIQGQVTAGATFTGVIAGANAAANVAGLQRLFIPNYNGTTFYKICEFTAWEVDTAAGLTHYQIGLEAALWTNTAGVSRVMMTPETAGKKFAVGTRMTIWGR